MSVFLVRVSSRALGELDLAAHLHFRPSSVAVYRTGDVTLYAFLAPTSLASAADQLDIRETSAVFLNGLAWPRTASEGPARPLAAADLHDRLDTQTVDQMSGALAGDHVVVYIGRHGVHAFCDELGIEHLYVARTDDEVFLTNRVSLLRAFAFNEPNLDALIWLPTVGYVTGLGVALRGVKRLEPRLIFHASSEGMTLRERPDSVFPRGDTERAWSDAALERGAEEVAQSIRVAMSAGKASLGLTGGKDSRLTLALLIGVGAHKDVSLFTKGSVGQPDVDAAVLVARRLGLEHRIVPRPVQAPAEHRARETLEKFCIHAAINEGMAGGWDLKATRRAGYGVTMGGLVGEVLKGYWKTSGHPSALVRASTVISRHGPFDPLKLLLPDRREQLDKALTSRLDEGLRWAGLAEDHKPDYFYASERIPNWLGTARKVDNLGVQVISPLNSRALIALSFRLTSTERRMSLIHFKAIARFAPELLGIPFAEREWDSGLTAYGAQPEHFSEPIRRAAGTPPAGSWQYFINDSKELRHQLIDLFLSYPQSEFWTWLDRGRLLKELAERTFAMADLISLFGLVPTFLWANGAANAPQIQLTAPPLDSSLSSRIL
jgi:hypothetical protein